MPRPLRTVTAALAALALGAGCNDTRLEYTLPPEDDTEVDNELTLEGSFCTSPPADVAFPVKIMFVVDGSGSLQFADQNLQRLVAVEETINALIGLPNVFFKVIVFNATVTATPGYQGEPPPPVFTNDLDALIPALSDLAQADTVTDYQGALSVAYSELLRDMTNVYGDPQRGVAELGRTKYVVVFISDGMPDPQCTAGLGNDTDPNFPNGVNLLCEDQAYIDCLLEVPPTQCADGVCQNGDTLCFQTEDASTLFGGINNVELAAGGDYNQPYQVLQKAKDIMELGERFEVGDLRMHTGLVLDPDADPAVIEIFGDPNQAAPLMEQMAEIGQGNYMEFYGGDDIDFLQLNFDALKQTRVVRDLVAYNLGTAPGPTDSAGVDTDFDGLADAREIDIGTSPFSADSDDDGYSDALEWRRRGFSFDPNAPCLPPRVDVPGVPATAECDPESPVNCRYQLIADPETGEQVRQYTDTDRDGVHDCEEVVLGTDLQNPDSDGDGIPDPLELRAGTDPAAWDSDTDSDQDGLPNGREIGWHLDPMRPESELDTRQRYRYDISEGEQTVDGRTCYDFAVRDLTLGATQANQDLAGGGVGYNDVRLYLMEGIADDLASPPVVRTTCVRARYIPPTLKQPADGEVTLDNEDFRYLLSRDPIFGEPQTLEKLYDPATDCRDVR